MNLDTTAQKSAYVVGLENSDLPPYSGYDGEHITGILKQVLDLVAKNLSIRFDYYVSTPADLIQKMDKGEIDFRFPDNPAWTSADDDKLFSAPVISFTDCFFLSADWVPKETGLMSCGSVQGYSLPVNKTAEFIDTYKWFESNHHVCQALQNGEIDLIYGNMVSLPLVAKDIAGLTLQPFAELPPHDGFYHFGGLAQHKDILQEINHWIDRNKRQLYAWNGESEIKL